MKSYKRSTLIILLLLFFSLAGCSAEKVKIISRGDFVFGDNDNLTLRVYHIGRRTSEPFLEFDKPIKKVEISNDGRIMAVQSIINKKNIDQSIIYVIDLDKERILGTIEDAFLLSVSPEHKIAYIQTDESTHQINLMDVKLKNRTVLNMIDPGQLSWSPDGKQVVYSMLDHGVNRIYILDILNQVTRELVPSNEHDQQHSPQWSPQGDKIFFTCDKNGISQIYSIDPDGSHLRMVKNGDKIILRPSISFDGKKFLYLSLDGEQWGLYVSSVDGKDETLLISGEDYPFGAVWLKFFE